MCVCVVWVLLYMRFMFIPNPAVEREWGWGSGLSNPWQMSRFYSKEWPSEFSLGQTRFCSKAGLLFSVGSGRRFARACAQPSLLCLPAGPAGHRRPELYLGGWSG